MKDTFRTGDRVEIPAYYDLWMRGARFGIVTGHRRGKPGLSDAIRVRMDHPQVRKSVYIPRCDWGAVRKEG